MNIKYRKWLKYALAALGGGLIMLQPIDSQESITRILMIAGITVSVFALLEMLDAIWPLPGANRRSTWRSVTWIILIAGVLLGLSFLGPWSFRSLKNHPSFEGTIAQLVGAGKGLLLPVLMLVVFTVLVLLKNRRMHLH